MSKESTDTGAISLEKLKIRVFCCLDLLIMFWLRVFSNLKRRDWRKTYRKHPFRSVSCSSCFVVIIVLIVFVIGFSPLRHLSHEKN